MTKRLLIGTLVIVTSLFVSTGCLYSRSTIERELFLRIKEQEGQELAQDLLKVKNAYFATVEPPAWKALEESFLQAEERLRLAGQFTPENSTKLRHEYLKKVDQLRTRIARETAMWNDLIAKAQNQSEGYAVAARIEVRTRELSQELQREATNAFDSFVKTVVDRVELRAAQEDLRRQLELQRRALEEEEPPVEEFVPEASDEVLIPSVNTEDDNGE